jgi:uncharacterized membrane protein (UPF0127 family)
MMMVVFSLICFSGYGQNEADTVKALNTYQPYRQLKEDTIDTREKFLQDSILARDQFVRDSILQKQRILDSLTLIQGELKPLLDAIQWTMKEDIISHSDNIDIEGDTGLGDYVYYKFPLSLSEPYTPWKGSISLNAKTFSLKIDQATRKISSIQSPSLRCNLNYANQGMVLIIQEAYVIQNHSIGQFFRNPIDSVFFDRNKRIVKIKRYVQFYKLVNSNRRGEFLFTKLLQVKQYQYVANNQMAQYELVKFCDSYKDYEPDKVCYKIKYSVTKQENNYVITRNSTPENAYSDGTFTLEYDENGTIKCLSFKNLANTQNWQRLVDLNKEGNVNCYTDKVDGVPFNALCMVYHKERDAKYPVEMINTIYEKDGISYLQKNLTTEKVRVRDRLTLEWGPWK